MERTILLIVMVVLGVLMLAALLRAILGPRFTDRMVAVNCVSTLITVLITLLSFYLKADYLLDVALIYAMLGFVANVVLVRILLARRRSQKAFEREVMESVRKEDEK